MAQRYLVLDSDPDDSFRWELDRLLQEHLADLGFEYRFREDKTDNLYQDVWEGKDTKAILDLVADLDAPYHYIMVASGSRELTDQIADKLLSIEAIPIISLEKLQNLAEVGDESSASALPRMALATDNYDVDKRSISIILSAFKHEQPLIRYRAVQAAGLALAIEFPPILKELAKNDPDEAVRSIAEKAILNYNPEYR